MKNPIQRFISFLIDEDGPTLVEYGLLILLIAVAAASAVGLFGVSVTGLFTFNFPAKLA